MREWWRALITGLGVLWMLLMLPSLGWSQVALSRLSSDIRGDALVAVVAACAVGWAVIPVVVASLDDSLDPSRFRPLGVEARRLMPGLAVAAFLTLPVLFFTLALGILTSAWAVDGPLVLAVAVLGMVLTVASLVFGARLGAAWAGRVLASRWARVTLGAAITLGVAAIIPLASALFEGGVAGVVEGSLETVLAALPGTPLAAGAGAPAALVEGDVARTLIRLATQAGWAVLLLLAWRATVAQALVSPPGRSVAVHRRRDAVLDGLALPWMRDDAPAAAVHARLSRAWAGDPRYLVSLVGVLVLPVAFVGLVIPMLDLDRRWAYAVPLMIAASIGWGRHNDVAFDSSGLWLDVVSGRLGGPVMRGRMSATAAWAVPVVVAAAVGIVAWSGRWEHALGLVGTSMGVLGLSLGVASVSSVLVPYRAPVPGHSPFAAEVGSVGAGLVAQLASSAVLVVLVPAVIAPFVLSLTVDPRWGWVALPGGIVAGAIAYLTGIRWAGTLYDKKAGTLLAAVS